jgi:hypothetical protein
VTITLTFAALRRHAFSLAFTVLLVTVSAALLGAPVPLALALWLIASLASLEAWRAGEPAVLQRLGCRPPNRLESERLDPVLKAAGLQISVGVVQRSDARAGTGARDTNCVEEVDSSQSGHTARLLDGIRVWASQISRSRSATRLRDADCGPVVNTSQPQLGAGLRTAIGLQVVDAQQPWVGTGLRNVVVSRALLDVLDDRALVGLLAQASHQLHSGSLPGELVVWLGNLPVLGVWYFARLLGWLGRCLAIVVGASLVLPVVLCPAGWTRWVGRLFGAVIIGLLGSTLVSSRLAAPGLGLLLAWAVVPVLAALLGWERRRAEQRADNATVAAGLGWHLLEALETLAWCESLEAPCRLLGLLRPGGAPIPDRADHLWRTLPTANPGAAAGD